MYEYIFLFNGRIINKLIGFLENLQNVGFYGVLDGYFQIVKLTLELCFELFPCHQNMFDVHFFQICLVQCCILIADVNIFMNVRYIEQFLPMRLISETVEIVTVLCLYRMIVHFIYREYLLNIVI